MPLKCFAKKKKKNEARDLNQYGICKHRETLETQFWFNPTPWRRLARLTPTRLEKEALSPI